MRLNPVFTLQSIAGEHFVFVKNEKQTDMTRVISFSDSAAWLWTQLVGEDFSIEDGTELLTEHYNVEKSIAESEVRKWVEQLEQIGLINI